MPLVSIEKLPTNSSREQLEEHINRVKTILAGKFSELVCNLDEVGSSE
jgi:hypothetical protein